MKRLSFLLLLPSTFVFGQISEMFEKAPPQVDEALRAQVTRYYDAHVSGKFRDILPLVAPDALDEFLTESRDTFKSCQIAKVTYADNFTKAKVLTACKNEFPWHGQKISGTYPSLSDWKLIDGKWYWYHVPVTSVQTPFGISSVTPEPDAKVQIIPKDPAVAAQEILSKVSIDKKEITLKSFEPASAQVQVTNNMPGGVEVTVDPLPYKGMHVKVDTPDLAQGGKATITISYDPADPAILCGACTRKVALPPITAMVRIMPISMVFPVQITFTATEPDPK